MNDDEVRALERAAASGDVDAERRLVAVRERRGRGPRFTISTHTGYVKCQKEHHPSVGVSYSPSGPNLFRAASGPSLIDLEVSFLQNGDASVPVDVLDLVRAVSAPETHPRLVALLHDHEKRRSYVLAQLATFMPPPPRVVPPPAPVSTTHDLAAWRESMAELDADLNPPDLELRNT